MVYIIVFVITTILFAIYVEISPSMGNIWYRYDSNNVKRISLSGLLNLMVFPFYNIHMWKIDLWSINIIIWLLFAFIVEILFIKPYLISNANNFQKIDL
jgi:hypothetical protein